MANPERGQVALEAGDKTYTLKFSTNAIRQAEAVSGKTFGKLCDEMELVGLDAMCVLLWAGLKQSHEGFTLDDAGDLVDELEPLEMIGKINEAIELAYPKTAKVGQAKASPRKAARR
jgi:hypothetical protein